MRWTHRLAQVRLYLIMDATPHVPLARFLDAALDGGVDMVQLREKRMEDAELLAIAQACAQTCRQRGVPFIVNDRADIALAADADGVHVGHADLPAAAVRALVGPERIVGVSTHTPAQIDAVSGDADYIGVGPIHETPTKPGRPAVGTALVRYATAHAGRPFFAIGGLDPSNVGEVIAAGGRGVSVYRWIVTSEDPARAAREMLAAMRATREEARS
jgi:thiamine-phosphate pyrophosphorylase